MNFKILALIIITVAYLFKMGMSLLELRSAGRPIPDQVCDVYEKNAYQNWISYHREKTHISMLGQTVSYLLAMVAFGFDLYALLANALPFQGYILPAMILIAADTLVGELFDLPTSYIDVMRIEQKYGFNKSTKKLFFTDRIKSLLLILVLVCGLNDLFIIIHRALGIWLLPVFGIILFAFILFVVFLYPFFTRAFNRFQPLPEGELRDKLLRLMAANNCAVRDILVMDASKRSTKANAYFSGMGKTKTIVLYDTLLEQMTTDEIVAVFAHEVGHNKFKHTLKMQAMSLFHIVLIVLVAWLLVSYPAICADFGFNGFNYGFAFILLFTVCIPLLEPLVGWMSNSLSRKFEYQSDRVAGEQGYAESMISALKKLARNSFANLSPDPLLVKLTYNHPSISQRIAALEQQISEKENQTKKKNDPTT